MSAKKKGFLDFYKDHMKYRRLRYDIGLCKAFYDYFEGYGYETTLLEDIFEPTKKDDLLYNPGAWWGGKTGEFTELRQNMVLFLAAINNEL